MFCVECGAEGPTYEGLCARDFLKKHPVVAPPDVLDLDRCTSCGSFRLASGWSKIDRELALAGLLRENIRKLPPWERVTFTHVACEEDANNLSLTVKALGRFEALQSVQDFRVRVRIKPTLCDSCPKLFGQKEGREVYRVTSLVRLGAFHVGDVVRHKGVLAEVTSARPFVVLRDLTTGEARRFKPKDVRTARRVDAERFEAKIERLDSGQVVAIHPESEEARPVRPRPEDRTARAVVVWTPEGAYLSKVPPGPSKA